MEPSFKKYWRDYKWSNIFEMVRNSFKKPKVCSDPFKGFVVITGATSGIGYQTARKYASFGAKLLTINRNKEKSESLCKELKDEFGAECSYIIADLSKLEDIKRVAKELSSINSDIDVLIHNAGIYLNRRVITEDGIEITFVVNYLSNFIITYSLLDKFKLQKHGRIIFVSSEGYRFAAWGLKLDDINWEKRKYTGLGAYGSAKLAQILSMMIFDEKLKGTGVTINAMHPGFVRTATGRDNDAVYKFFKRNILDRLASSPEVSAEALYYLGVSKEIEGVSGKFFNLTTIEELAPPAKDREVANDLWNLSLKLGGFV